MQEVTAQVEIVTQILKQIPMVIFALFLGPWSDKAGRKILILLPFLGYILYCITFVVNVYFFDELKVEFLCLESLCSFSGGNIMLFLGAYGYICDTSSPKSRTFRIAVMDGMLAAGGTIGGFVNGYIFASLGYYGSFGSALTCYTLAFGIVFFKLQNIKIYQEKETNNPVFDMKNVSESFKVLTKRRPESMRHIVIILVVCFQISSFSWYGTYGPTDYLCVRRKFDWSDENILVNYKTKGLSILL